MWSASYGYVDDDDSDVKKYGDGDGGDGFRASTEYIVLLKIFEGGADEVRQRKIHHSELRGEADGQRLTRTKLEAPKERDKIPTIGTRS